MVTSKFLIETISTSKNWFSFLIWTFFCEIFKKLNWHLHNWSNHYFFQFWFNSVVVCQSIIFWIRFYGKFRFSRHWLVQSSGLSEKKYSDFHTEGNHNNSECFSALQLWFLELSWCEALSLKFPRPYCVDFSVNSCSGKVLDRLRNSHNEAVLLS